MRLLSKPAINCAMLVFVPLAVSLLASCRNNETSQSQSPSRDKIAIGEVSGERDERIRALGVSFWTFDISVPESHRQFNYQLELREKGKKPRTLGGSGAVNFKKIDGQAMEIMFDPSDFSIYKADKWKVSVRINKQFGSRVIIDNPFKEFKVIEHTYNSRLDDGSIILLRATRREMPTAQRKPDDEDAQLVLKLSSSESPYGG